MPSDRRLHPASVLFSFVEQLKNFALPGLLVLFGASRAGSWEPWLMVLIVPSSVAAILRYLSFRYRYEEHDMVIRKGFIFRSERHVPYARIQNLDAVQNIAHRVLDVVEVRVQTGGGSEPEAVMSVIPVAAYREMRARVFALRLADARSGQEPEVPALSSQPGAPTSLLRLSLRELMIAGFIENRGMVVIAAAFGLLYEFGGIDPLVERIFGEQESGRGMVRNLFASLRGADVFDPRRLLIGITAFAGLLLLIRMLSMGLAVVRLYGFELRQEGEDLRSEFGLITRIVATIPLRRIQTLTIYEGPLHRRFKRVAVKVETAGGEGQKAAAAERAWLAPIIAPQDLASLLHHVVPELELDALDWQPLHVKAFRRVLRGSLMFWMPVIVFAGIWLDYGVRFSSGFAFGWTPILVPLMIALCVVGARQYVRHARWAIGDHVIASRRGWIWRTTTVARFAKIQAVSLHESPFDRRWSMARVTVDTAGSDNRGERVALSLLPRDVAEHLYRRLGAAAASTEFRW